MLFRVIPAWLTVLGVCLFLAVAWVAIGMVLVFLHPNPWLLITALVCLIAAGGIEFSKDEGDFR